MIEYQVNGYKISKLSPLKYKKEAIDKATAILFSIRKAKHVEDLPTDGDIGSYEEEFSPFKFNDIKKKKEEKKLVI